MNHSNKKIQILLSTYNGEKYLREQLDSYLSLDNYSEVKVLIRDDGSTDKTPEILNEYKEKHGFEIISGENIGLNASMYELIKNRDKACEYFSFSDQDDVWLPDKLSRAVNALKNENAPIALYVACSHLTDDELNIKGHTFVAKKPIVFYNTMIQNVSPGHAQVCTASLAEILEKIYSSDMMVYDYWVALLASAVGKVIFDAKPTTLYRQHKTNAIGCESSKIKVLKMRISRVKTKKSILNAKQLKAFCNLASDIIPEHYLNEVNRFFKYQKSFFTRLKYVFTSKAYRQTSSETMIFKLMYLFKRYNV